MPSLFPCARQLKDSLLKGLGASLSRRAF